MLTQLQMQLANINADTTTNATANTTPSITTNATANIPANTTPSLTTNATANIPANTTPSTTANITDAIRHCVKGSQFAQAEWCV